MSVLWKFLKDKGNLLCRLSSGYRYPLPWYRIPPNTYLCVRLILELIFSSRFRMLAKHRKHNGITARHPQLKPYDKQIQMICPSLPELDFPLTVPSNVTPCGPIILPATPVSQIDPELASWLQRGPTILVNMGTHYMIDAISAHEMASFAESNS